MSDRTTKTPKPTLGNMTVSDLFRRRSSAADDPIGQRKAFVPGLPTVNLLPKAVKDDVLAAKVRRGFALALVLVVALSAGVWLLQSSRISQATDAVADATAVNTQVRSDLDTLTPVRQMYDQITTLQQVVTGTLAAQPQAELLVAEVISAGKTAAGDQMSFRDIDVVYSGIPMLGDSLNPCPNPDPFGTEIAIGCITFNATVASRSQVSDLLRILEANPLFVGPYVTTSTVSTVDGDRDYVTFTGSAGVSLEGLETMLTPEEIEKIVNPPVTSTDAGSQNAASETAQEALR